MNINKALFVISIALILFYFSCARKATGPAFNQVELDDDKKALVYIYRPHTGCDSFRKFDISVDGKIVVELLDQGYTWVALDPGKHLIRIKGTSNIPSIAETLDVESTQTYFIKYHTNCPSETSFRAFFTLLEVPESTALKEISDCRFIEPNK